MCVCVIVGVVSGGPSTFGAPGNGREHQTHYLFYASRGRKMSENAAPLFTPPPVRPCLELLLGVV